MASEWGKFEFVEEVYQGNHQLPTHILESDCMMCRRWQKSFSLLIHFMPACTSVTVSCFLSKAYQDHYVLQSYLCFKQMLTGVQTTNEITFKQVCGKEKKKKNSDNILLWCVSSASPVSVSVRRALHCTQWVQDNLRWWQKLIKLHQTKN